MNNYKWHKNIHISHPSAISPIFRGFLNDFDTIIEIGTYAGGLTVWMADNSRAKIITYDINNPTSLPLETGVKNIHETFKKSNIEFNLISCFECKEKIQEQIKNGGKCLVLCDGGNKIEEFKTFAPMLKEKDCIACHDYSDNDNYFNKRKKELEWQYDPEIRMNDIKDTIEKQKLKEHKDYKNMKSVFWGMWENANI